MTIVAAPVYGAQTWPSSAWSLLVTAFLTFITQLAWRPRLTKRAPSFPKISDWPIVGAWRFYSQRLDFFKENQSASKTGNFTFYVGRRQVVGLSGEEGRKTFFESKALELSSGYSALHGGIPTRPEAEQDGGMWQWVRKMMVQMLKRNNFVKNLPILTSDIRTALEELANAPPASTSDAKGWKVFNPFEDLYNTVYKLTVRTVGCKDIAEDPVLLSETLSLYHKLDRLKSTVRYFFPWMPTLNHVRRMYTGLKLYNIFAKIADDRRETGKREDDAMQFLIDRGSDNSRIIQFVILSLFAGQINSGVHASWIPTYLATYPEWKARVRAEVDSVIERHRTSKSQTPAEILDTLGLDEWESEFKVIGACLRESIRLASVGTAIRRNISGTHVPIGSSREAIPPDAFAVYLVDDVHMNPAIYAEPDRFDPGRFLEGRDEDKKQPNAFLGWGAGRHSCLGMRFAKLEVTLIIAYLFSMFDIELSDSKGNLRTEPPPPIDRNEVNVDMPREITYLRYRLR